MSGRGGMLMVRLLLERAGLIWLLEYEGGTKQVASDD